jgi:ribosomal protein L11 methyltransferase
MNYDYENPDFDYFNHLGGNQSALSIFRYDLEYLRDLRAKLEKTFSHRIQCTEQSMETEVWLEGWKSSFKAFSTEKFTIYPPWDQESSQTNLIPVEIEPGMAFGTGQHATTQLCLRELENLPELTNTSTILDVGTGTGILAIALAKLGYSAITGTDIDCDAVIAAKENALKNKVSLAIATGTVPAELEDQACDLIIANILMVVLRKITKNLAQALAPCGYLLVSGVLDSEMAEMQELAASYQLNLVRTNEQDGWVSLLLRKS